MKLSEHFKDIFKRFDYLEAALTEENSEKMYGMWSKKYSTCLKNASEEKQIEMISRTIRARRELMTSALLWAEAKSVKSSGCITAYYFLRYYSLFHAMWSVLFLNPEIDRKIVDSTHSKLQTLFCNYYANYDYCVFDRELADFIASARDHREIYSYNRPNNLLHVPESEEKQEKVLLICYQLTNLFTSMMRKKISAVDVTVTNRKTMIDEFSFFNGRINEDGTYEFDPFEKNILYEIKKYGMAIMELEVVLGHDWDELGYNSVTKEAFSVEAVDKIKGDAISFIYRAIPFL